MEARVLSSTLLSSTAAAALLASTAAAGSGRAAGTMNSPLYQVRLLVSGGPAVQVITEQPLQSGQLLQLRLHQSGQLWLQHTAAKPAPAGEQPSTTLHATLQSWMRQILPRQAPLQELPPVMQHWLNHATDPVAKGLAQRWLAALLTPAQVMTARTLHAALLDSGTLCESLWLRSVVAHDKADPPTDQKTLLQQLLHRLQSFPAHAPAERSTASPAGRPPLQAGTQTTASNPSDKTARDPGTEALVRQLGATLARMQLHQLDSLGIRQGADSEPQQSTATWSFELPLRDGSGFSSLELRIQQRKAREDRSHAHQWHVDLHLDLHEHGRLSAQLTLQGQSVSALLWAEQSSTHRRVREHLSLLRNRLETIGVKVKQLDCRHGTAPAKTPRLPRQLIDVRT